MVLGPRQIAKKLKQERKREQKRIEEAEKLPAWFINPLDEPEEDCFLDAAN